MANLNRANLITESATLFPDNNTQEISPADLRSWLADGTASFVTQKDKSTLENAIFENKATTLPSAGVVDLNSATGNYLHISGSVAITSFGTCPAGARFVLMFEGTPTLTYNATSLIIPGGTNKTVVAGDCCMIVSEGSGNWRIVGYFVAAGAGAGTITGVTAGTGLSGGGTSGAVTLNLANTAVTPAAYTNANITVDAQGRITAAADGTGGSGITALTGDVTASGTGSVAATIANSAVDLAMLSATGSPSSGNFLRGDYTWAIPVASYTSTVQHQVKLGVAINKGQAVYVTGADGTNMIVGKASNTSEATSSKTMGLIDVSGATNAFVNVITEGLLAGLNTNAAGAAGDPVWLGVNGDLIYGLVNKPYAPDHLVFIGIVTRKNAVNGEIFVKVQNGFELKEIHDVQAQSPALNDTLYYDNTVTPPQWKTAQITSIATVATESLSGIVTTSAQTFGGIKSFGNGASAGEIRLLEPSGSGTNSVGIKAQAMGSNWDLTLPVNAGTSGQVLQTNGSGGLSWTRNGGTINSSYILDTTETSTTGTVETINKTLLIPANTFSAQTAFKIVVRLRKDNVGFNVTNNRIYIGTNPASIVGAFNLGLYTFVAASNLSGTIMERSVLIINATTSTQYNLPNNGISTITDLNNGINTINAIDWTVSQYIIVTTSASNAAYSAFVRAIQIIPQ